MKVRAVLIGALLLGCPFGVLAEQAEPAAEEEQNPVFKVDKHIFAAQVGFDKRGRCKAKRGRALKAWRVPWFPAAIPPFQSCLTVSSPTGRGLMDFELSIVDKQGEQLLMVEGAIEFGHQGSASQAVNWDHLEIPEPGKYFMVVVIEGDEVARFPMKFSRRRK